MKRTSRLTIRLTPDEKTSLLMQAKALHISMTGLVCMWIKNEMK